MVNYVNVEYH
ncbi:hypothetical protein KGM_214859 [Danaus plexippus plexippus]|uniref:Uncharacterized protein n=1 Tax=Danaus plexippus plexippus TaxID=278856 RepID=A0A212EK94_DANPL|nr:hypothetical protein KGM_214859 [Danaus plexippus plexippus]